MRLIHTHALLLTAVNCQRMRCAPRPRVAAVDVDPSGRLSRRKRSWAAKYRNKESEGESRSFDRSPPPLRCRLSLVEADLLLHFLFHSFRRAADASRLCSNACIVLSMPRARIHTQSPSECNTGDVRARGSFSGSLIRAKNSEYLCLGSFLLKRIQFSYYRSLFVLLPLFF